jgi:hypothetical protein
VRVFESVKKHPTNTARFFFTAIPLIHLDSTTLPSACTAQVVTWAHFDEQIARLSGVVAIFG